MKTWKQFNENLGGGLSSWEGKPPNREELDIGQAKLRLLVRYQQLIIDTANVSANIHLTPAQFKQLLDEFTAK